MVFLGFLSLNVMSQSSPTVFDDVQKNALESNKMILINFSGSDWCNPCIRMKNEIFSSPVFEELTREDLLFFNADFPRMRKNKLSEEMNKQNEGLAEKYNQKGIFPMTVLINAEGKVLKSWEGYPKMDPVEFVDEIRTILPVEKAEKKKSTAGPSN